MRSVVVRWARIDAAPTDDDALDDAARARCARLRADDDRRRFVGARLLLRRVVADVTGCQPNDIDIQQRCPRCGDPHGDPAVTLAGRRGPCVSMAHAGALAVVAIGSAPVGVDVEPIDAADDVQHWVRTEALLKATGHGLDVDHEHVVLAGTRHPRLVGWPGPGRRPSLRVRDAELAAGYVGAVARLGRLPMRVDVGEVALRRD